MTAPLPTSDSAPDAALTPTVLPLTPPNDPSHAAGAGPSRRANDAGDAGQRSRPTDRLLHLLLLAAERDVRRGLTVTVGGVVVSGTLIGTMAFCRRLADQFASTGGGTGMDETFAEAFGSLVDEVNGVGQGDRRHPADAASYAQATAFVHLADARYVSGGPGPLPHGRHGVLWRCRTADVTSWSLGDLIPG